MSKFFINRPIVAMVISIVMVIIGIVAMVQLPIAQFPELAPPEILLNATYVGADALTLEQSVATPIEQQLQGVDNMIYMNSTNAASGLMRLRVDFDVGTNANTDQILTQMRYLQAESQLPLDVRNQGVTILKSATSPLALFSLYSPKGTYDGTFLANYAYININDPMSRVPGIGQVAIFGAQKYNQIGRLNGNPAAIIAIYQLPGSNAIDTMNQAKQLMEDLKKRFPQDLDYTVSLDTTLAVTAGIEEIVKTLFEALALVIIVVFIFLQNWRATLIPLLAVPVSLVGTFAIFPLLGFSINTLSLFGLVLAIGLVVDDAIVVVEAVERHLEEGLAPRAATLQAMEEVSGPVIAIALILVAVFIPSAFIPGITGGLYQQFAVTTAVSVVISAFNALTLSPALSALLLRPRRQVRGPVGAFFRGFNRGFGRITEG